jgi:hypothetical protein
MTTRRPSALLQRLLAPAFGWLTGYMTLTGLLAFADDPAATPSLMADPPADPGPGGDPAKPADPAAPAADPTKAVDPAADPTKPADPPKEPDAKPASKAPEKYEFKAPEGLELNEALTAEFEPVLRGLDLTQEQADQLLAFAPKLIEPAVDAAITQTLDSLGYAGCKDWAAQVQADKELGGEKLAQTMGVVNKALNTFATPGLQKLLKTTVLGNHPELVRLFHRIGKEISADGYVPGGKTVTTAGDARAMYPASQMNP